MKTNNIPVHRTYSYLTRCWTNTACEFRKVICL